MIVGWWIILCGRKKNRILIFLARFATLIGVKKLIFYSFYFAEFFLGGDILFWSALKPYPPLLPHRAGARVFRLGKIKYNSHFQAKSEVCLRIGLNLHCRIKY